MRNLARIGLVAAFAACAIVGGCNKSARVEESAAATKACSAKAEGGACCADKMAQEKSAGCCADKASNASSSGQCPMSKAQNN